jgi:hypothetical protein
MSSGNRLGHGLSVAFKILVTPFDVSSRTRECFLWKIEVRHAKGWSVSLMKTVFPVTFSWVQHWFYYGVNCRNSGERCEMWDLRFLRRWGWLLLFSVVTSCRLIGGYQRFGETHCLHLQPLSPSSTLKMEIVCFSEMLVSTYGYTRCHNPEEQHSHWRERMKSYFLDSVCVFAEQIALLSTNVAKSSMTLFFCCVCLFNRVMQTWLVIRIWGSHGGEYEDGCLLGCSAV